MRKEKQQNTETETAILFKDRELDEFNLYHYLRRKYEEQLQMVNVQIENIFKRRPDLR